VLDIICVRTYLSELGDCKKNCVNLLHSKIPKEVAWLLDRKKLRGLLREKYVKSLDDFNTFKQEGGKDVIETFLDDELIGI